jgi:hypothetical protein
MGDKIKHFEHGYDYKVEYEYIVPHDKIRPIFAKVLKRSNILSNIDKNFVHKNNDRNDNNNDDDDDVDKNRFKNTVHKNNDNSDDINNEMKVEIESIVVLSDGTAMKLNFYI